MLSDRCTHCQGSHTGARPCFASATVKARAWLLIEHPGPWADRLDDTTLAAPVRRALARAMEQDVESVSEAPVSEVVVALGAERYRVIVARVPLDACQPGCEAEASTYVLKGLT